MMQDRDESMQDDEDPAATAYATISRQLGTWTSPRDYHRGMSSSYGTDSVEYVQQELLGDDEMMEDEEELGQKTPVMSNSAKKKAIVKVPDAARLPQSPAIVRTKSLFSSSTLQAHEFRRYHDILNQYCSDRRQWSERWELRNTEQEKQKLMNEERQMELEYLSNLTSTCESLSYEGASDAGASQQDDVAWLEANAWSLLGTLRSLGRDFLLWDQQAMDAQEQRAFRMQTDDEQQQLVTPAQLVEDLYESKPSLQRRKSILSWLQQCRRKLNKEGVSKTATQRAMWPDSLQHLSQGRATNGKISQMDPDAPLLCNGNPQNPLYGKDGEREQQLLQQCLNYILAGRVDQAFALCKQYGQPWRCASWSGGNWEGVEMDTSTGTYKIVGNPNRALWKRTCWKLAEAPGVTSYEAAINALLSNHVKMAVANTALRSWESCLFACLDASLQRAEDQHVFAKLPRCPKAEQEHLQATIDTTNQYRNEESIIAMMESLPFPEHHIMDPFRDVMAAVMVGHKNVLQYALSQGNEISVTTPHSFVRFLTHFILYLDSLTVSSVSLPWDETVLSDIKNNLLHLYLEILSSHPDLWRHMTLYASLLPVEIMYDIYPDMLIPIEDDTERAALVKQMTSLFGSAFGPGVEVDVLREVVKLLRGDEQRQMRSIRWLCHSKAHWGDALISTNALLRQWLLSTDDQISHALLFVDKYLPDEVVAEAEVAAAEVNDDVHMFVQDDARILQLERARLEFGALLCYLEAHKAFLEWKDTMETTSSTTSVSGASVVTDASNLNKTEKDIARSMEKREFLRQKQQDSRRVVEAADKARDELMQVLRYDGGWLLLDEGEENETTDDPDVAQHVKELKALHSRYLPQTVFLLHSLCDETATWMEESLDNAIEVVGEKALSLLDSTEDSTSSPLSPLYWTRHALSLAPMVASDEFAIQDAFGEADEHHFTSLMAETEVRELQYKADL